VVSLKRKSARGLLLVCVCVFFTLPLLGGKGGKGDEKRELRFWHSIGTYNKDLLNSLIESYNQKNRQASVRGVFQGTETDLYLKLLSPETRPDIVQVSVQFLPDLVEKNQLVDLTAMIPGKLKEDVPEKFWSSVSVQERTYGIPFLYSVQLLYANQHVLRNAGVRSGGTPESWSDLLAWSEKIRANQGEKWPLFIPMESVVQFLNFAQSYTGEPVIRDGRLRIDSENVIGAMQFLRDLVYEKRFMPAKISIDEGENLFLGGNLGIMSASSSLLVYTESNLPYDMNVWELPASDRVHPLVSGTCLAILRSSTRTEKESYRFIEYLTDYENAIKWHTHTGNPAIRRSVKGSLDLLVFYEDNPNHMVSVNQMEEGRIFTPSTGFLQVSEIIKAALESIMLKGESPGVVLRNAQAALDRLDVRF
jgi:ABC-type glycerol-3-phosphate transport system substrate-binding protein